MNEALTRLVRARAKGRCEYCRMPEAFSMIPFEVDHIIAIKHRGPTEPANLALACFYCNSFKGPNLAGIDINSGRIARLFHPRKDRWAAHFSRDGPYLVGRTRIGRATVAVLEFNHPAAVMVRESLIEEGGIL